MVLLLVPALCIPQDFINPFPPLLQAAAVCAGLLLAATALLLFAWRGRRRAIQQWWLRYAVRTGSIIVFAGMLWSLGLALWLWGVNSSFKGWCSIGADPRLATQFQALQTAQSIVPVTTNLTIAALLVALATALAILLSRKGSRNTNSHAEAGA
jgi:hypothetical protein